MQCPHCDGNGGRDAHVIRQTVAHLHTLAIEQHKRSAEIQRHLRDIKFGVFMLLVMIFLIAIFFSQAKG